MRLFVILTGLLVVTTLQAQALEVGDAAPAAEAKDDAGHAWTLSDYVGKHVVVIYFYPADMTPGCTKQACAYRDSKDALEAAGVKVFGVSGDSPEGHQVFKKAYNLNYTLLSDTEGALAKAFGVPAGKGGTIQRDVEGAKVSLTRGVTAQRWTFVIGKDGKVVHKNTKVNPAADVKQVLDSLK